MNIAVVFAGGTGRRMNMGAHTKPKQFLKLHGKPVIIYTLEQFQQHEEIDGIVVSCLESWISHCSNLINQYHLTKVSAIVPGGDTGQVSIFNGLSRAGELYPDDSIVLIHDGVRPLINAETITKNIACAKARGSAITVSPAIETIAVKASDDVVGQIIHRNDCQMARAPQCFRLHEILDAHYKAQSEHLENFTDSACLMRYYGYPLYTVEGPAENIKITTPVDFYIFRAIEEAQENSQIFGF